MKGPSDRQLDDDIKDVTEGACFAFRRPRGETAVLKHFQARMPYGLVVPDVDER
jgi:hypothetical protein